MTRKVTPMQFVGVEPGEPTTLPPEFRWVDPASLLVDEVYQRDLSRGSVELIKKIVAGWDWARFKPPVVAETAEGLEVIDGQHTAIAATTHGGLGQIPVMVVRAAEMADRARAFVGHNRDRLMLSQVNIHYANVAAGGSLSSLRPASGSYPPQTWTSTTWRPLCASWLVDLDTKICLPFGCASCARRRLMRRGWRPIERKAFSQRSARNVNGLWTS